MRDEPEGPLWLVLMGVAGGLDWMDRHMPLLIWLAAIAGLGGAVTGVIPDPRGLFQ